MQTLLIGWGGGGGGGSSYASYWAFFIKDFVIIVNVDKDFTNVRLNQWILFTEKSMGFNIHDNKHLI